MMRSRTSRAAAALTVVAALAACSSDDPDATPDPSERVEESVPPGDDAGPDDTDELDASGVDSSFDVTESDVRSTAEVRVREIISDYDGRETDQGTVLTVPAEVLFDFDQDTLRPDARDTLVEVVEVLEFYEGAPVEVIGHTDARGAEAYNDALSLRRAEAVRAHLAGAGIDPGRLTVDGRGAREPVAANDTDEGRQQNRRVEVLVRGVAPPPADD